MTNNRHLTSIPSAFSGPDDQGKGRVPLLFQVLSPDFKTPLLPEALFLHVNPSSLDFSYAKIIERQQTRGGFVEQHFGDELTDVSADQSTGTFVHVEEGLTIAQRSETVAHQKMSHLIDLFKNNGLIYDDEGFPQFRGRIRLTWHGGIYDGSFRSFEVSEAAEEPFKLDLSWDFTVEKETHKVVV